MKKYLYLVFLAISCWTCNDEDPTTPTPMSGPQVNIINYDITEANEDKTLIIKVGFTEALSASLVMQYELVDQTATAEKDYAPLPVGQLIFEVGEISKDIVLTILGDFIPEADETFQVRLFSTFGSFEEGSSTITILNDDTSIEDLVIPSGMTSPTDYAGYQLAWADEFDTNELSEENWTHEIGNGCPNLCGWGNNELEFYSPENLYFRDDDYLVIQARPEKIGFNDYTSSRIITADKKEFQYGRIDVRAVLPEGQGIWPALWMLGANINTVGWPASGEIDIMELIGSAPSTVHGTFHYGNSFPEHTFQGSSNTLSAGQRFSESFHIFSLIWEEDHVQILLDNELVHEIRPELTEPQNYPFNAPFFFIFNIAVGGNWPGKPGLSTEFPQHMIVDYIRVFQK